MSGVYYESNAEREARQTKEKVAELKARLTEDRIVYRKIHWVEKKKEDGSEK